MAFRIRFFSSGEFLIVLIDCDKLIAIVGFRFGSIFRGGVAERPCSVNDGSLIIFRRVPLSVGAQNVCLKLKNYADSVCGLLQNYCVEFNTRFEIVKYTLHIRFVRGDVLFRSLDGYILHSGSHSRTHVRKRAFSRTNYIFKYQSYFSRFN